MTRSHMIRELGHNCVWHSQLAPWVTAGNFSAPELSSIITKHCGTLVRHYRGDICASVLVFHDSATVLTYLLSQTAGMSSMVSSITPNSRISVLILVLPHRAVQR